MIDKPQELTIIYNSNKATDIKARIFVESLPGYAVTAVDLTHDSLTKNQIATLARKMNVNIEDLLDPAYDDHIGVHKEGLKIMSRTELLTLMADDSKIMSTPILVLENSASKYSSFYDLINLESHY